MNCVMSGGYVNTVDKIVYELEMKGIYEKDNYLIFPISRGDFKLYTIKYRNHSISPLFDNLQEAIEMFLKLTRN